MQTILFSAGDVSGEMHAAALVRALAARRPATRFVGLGGSRMRAAGVEVVVDQRELAIGGIVELLPELGRIVRAWARLGRALRETSPELVVLVDSGGFNLPFARRVRRTSRAKILYFIAPQVWAWRPHRLRALAARADRIVVCLPFERDHHAARGVRVDWFGHPIVDAFTQARRGDPPDESPSARRARVRRELELPREVPLLGIFPGSRRSELARHLPLQLAAFRRLRASSPRLAATIAVLGRAPGIGEAEIRRIAGPLVEPADEAIRIVETGDGRLLDALDVALTKPGTITLEAALAGCPMVVVGRTHPITAWLARRSAQIASVALPNLLAESPFVPELLQADATPERLAMALEPLFDGPERLRQQAGLARVAQRLGPPGAIERTASLVEEMLASPRA
ncbi:MAG: lipid-A-disaccharide synthase [Myxococcota bacterium]